MLPTIRKKYGDFRNFDGLFIGSSLIRIIEGANVKNLRNFGDWPLKHQENTILLEHTKSLTKVTPYFLCKITRVHVCDTLQHPVSGLSRTKGLPTFDQLFPVQMPKIR